MTALRAEATLVTLDREARKRAEPMAEVRTAADWLAGSRQ